MEEWTSILLDYTQTGRWPLPPEMRERLGMVHVDGAYNLLFAHVPASFPPVDWSEYRLTPAEESICEMLRLAGGAPVQNKALMGGYGWANTHIRNIRNKGVVIHLFRGRGYYLKREDFDERG